jgi:cyclic-di-GMP-binding biofilm dispersal mediator protein
MGRDLTDSVVLLAGASGGLGSAIGAELADRGASLTLIGRSPERLDALDLDGLRVVGDLADSSTGERAVEASLAAFGRVDGVVNAAGEVAFGRLADTTDDTLDRLVASNLLGPLRLVRAALPHIDHGFVVNISAVVAEQPPAGMAAYAATKAALTATTVSLRRELRRQRIDVIDVRPPHTETGLAQRPLAGEAPSLPQGMAPEAVAARVVEAIIAGDREIGAADFVEGGPR